MRVLWSEEAKATFNQNILYLEKEWNQSVIDNFLDKTDTSISAISKHPLLFPIVGKGNKIHKCLVVTQVSLYYKIVGDEIHLLTFWNNYKDPEKLKL